MTTTPAKGSELSPENEYDPQLGHTIWELERALKRGHDSESLRRALVEAHVDELRMLEDRAGMPRPQRSFLLLQPRPAESLLLLPGELAGADDVLPIAEHFHQRGFAALGSSLAYRVLDEPARSPHFWQTCADEAEGRFDILERYSTRIAVLGVGMGALMALHLASARRVSAVLALFPTLHVTESWRLRLRTTLNRLLRRESETSLGWNHQRRLAALRAHETMTKISVPLFLVAEDKRDRTDVARSSRDAQRLISRAATQVHMLPPGETAPRSLPPALLDTLLAFTRKQ